MINVMREASCKPNEPNDHALDTLLLLNGEIYPMDNGYWVKFEAWRIEPSVQVPHGIRYSVTLHDRYNRRVLGFDNSHGFTPERKRFGARKLTWDHKHHRDEIAPYEFESPVQLLEDFWRDAERMMAEGA